MRIFTVLGIIFYTTVLSLMGILFIIISLNWIPLQVMNSWLLYLQNDSQLRFILGSIGILLILISISFAQLILGKIQREKTIAFSNPSGEITISLTAVEDLIGRIMHSFSEIKDARSDVIATKKGIEVNLKISLKTEVNIPEFTAQLQELLKAKIQEILGIEEPITVKIHVAKIMLPSEKSETKRTESPTIPFQGFRKI